MNHSETGQGEPEKMKTDKRGVKHWQKRLQMAQWW